MIRTPTQCTVFEGIVLAYNIQFVNSSPSSFSTSEPSARELSMFKEELNKAIQADPLTHLNASEKELVWKFRNYCSTIPEALPKLLRCLDWASLDDVSTCATVVGISSSLFGCDLIDLGTYFRL